MTTEHAPAPDVIAAEFERQRGKVVRTPVLEWWGPARDALLGVDTPVAFKLELFQKTGTFKLRGALSVLESLDAESRRRGVVAASGGNHAIAVSFAARLAGVDAKVVIPDTANPFRRRQCAAHGATIISAATIHEAFETAERIACEEGRAIVHPFEGYHTTLGTATLGHELVEQVPDLDVVIVPVGGGGLCSGVAAAVRQRLPRCRVFGVEPEGADTMYRSFRAGAPVGIEKVATIADSLGAPRALPYSFAVCRQYVEDIVLVSDQQLENAMKLLMEDVKLAVEPAGAAATAAAVGPLSGICRGKRVGIIVCGANIDSGTYSSLLLKAE